jgi:pyruvate kinase
VEALSREDEINVDIERAEGIENQIKRAAQALKQQGRVRPGDRMVVAAGVPLHEKGTTNLVKVIEVEG